MATNDRGYIDVDDSAGRTCPACGPLATAMGAVPLHTRPYNDYEIVAANLFEDDPRRISDRIPCYALNTDPLGRVGMTMQETRDSRKRVLVAHRPMTKVSRAREMGETNGFMRARRGQCHRAAAPRRRAPVPG